MDEFGSQQTLANIRILEYSPEPVVPHIPRNMVKRNYPTDRLLQVAPDRIEIDFPRLE